MFFIGVQVVHAQQLLPSKKDIRNEKRLEKLAQKSLKKEQKRQLRLMEKAMNQRRDSLIQVIKGDLPVVPVNIPTDSSINLPTAAGELTHGALKRHPEAQKLNPYLEAYKKNTTRLKKLKKDSTAFRKVVVNTGKEVLNEREETRALRKELKPYLNSPYLKEVKKMRKLKGLKADSLRTLRQHTFNNLQKQVEKDIKRRKELASFTGTIDQFEALQRLPESYRKQFEKYQDSDQVKKQVKEQAVAEATKQLEAQTQKIQSAQKELGKLKKKYLSVQSSGDLSTAVKRNSLKGRPFFKRLVFGGNLQVVTIDPVLIDLSPLVGYRLDKRWEFALGATYRARFSESNRAYLYLGKDDLTYGYRSFSTYRFWKSFYVHAEYERVSKEFEIGTTDTYERKWKAGAFIGVGNSYRLKGYVRGQVSLLYNFLHDQNERVYSSPWVFRFGFTIMPKDKPIQLKTTRNQP